MKTKTLINLSLILIIAILAFFARKSYQDYQAQKPNAYLEAVNAFPKDNVSQIIIERNEDQLFFNKNAQVWTVNDKRASAPQVNLLLNNLFPSTSPLLLATTQDQLNNLNLSTASATQVTVNSGDQSLTFLVGSRGVNTPVSIKGSGQAYALNSLPLLDFDLDSWVDLNITSFNDGDINQISLPNFTLIKADQGSWTVADSDQAISADSVNTYLAKLNPLTARSLASDEDLVNYNLNTPTFTLNLVGQNSSGVNLEFFRGQEDYLVRRSIVDTNEEELFLLSSFQAENLNKDLGTFTN